MNLKKPKFWDNKKPNLNAYLLYPLAFFIETIKKLFPKPNKKKFKIKTICIGNILVSYLHMKALQNLPFLNSYYLAYLKKLLLKLYILFFI